MFLHMLEERQRDVFCRLAIHLVKGDGVLDLREEVALEKALLEMHRTWDDLPQEEATSDELVQQAEALFTSPESRRVLLMELVLIALSDLKADQGERHLLRELCGRFAVKAAALEAYRDFALRLIALREEGEGLIYVDEA